MSAFARNTLLSNNVRIDKTGSVGVGFTQDGWYMLQDGVLAKSVSDAGMREFRRQMEYKTVWNGSTLMLADRYYPSSKRCSGCGRVKDVLALDERTYHCEGCGLVEDRDVNASKNLEQWALAVS